MLPFEDIAFQLVDLPPVSVEFLQPELTLRSTDGALLVVDLSAPDCTEQLERILRQLAAGKIACTVSMGLAGIEAGEATLDELLARADSALYRAKADGRNRVEAG